MTLQKFLEIWNGKPCEVAGSANAKNQCVDLANAYLRDVCNHSIVEWTNACDFPSKIKDMEWIVNDEETDLPKEGDIIIWSNKISNGAGHIAIFLDGTTSKFNSFDQNWPLYSPCHVQSHSYTNVIGWLRPKLVINSEENMTAEETKILEFVRKNKITEGQIRQGYGYITDNIEEKISKLEKKVETLTQKVKDLTDSQMSDGKTASEWQKEYDSASAEIQTWKKKSLQASAFSDIVNELVNRLFKK